MIDPAARGRSQVDGTRLIEQYSALGLALEPPKNAVEADIYAVWETATKHGPCWLALG